MQKNHPLRLVKSMFGKKPPSEPSKSNSPDQSQSIDNSKISGSAIEMGQAGGNLQQEQTANTQAQEQEITANEVVAWLEQLEAAVKATAIDPAQQEELLDYLRPAKREAAKESPNKELVGQNLKRVSETLKVLSETTESGRKLWQTGLAVFKSVAPWLGVAAAFFGL